MSRLTRSARLLKKAEAALMAAIEIYNKPTFSYRTEAFAILALNAWELLAKAVLLDVSFNKLRCLYVFVPPKTKTGAPSKRLRIKRNRTKNPMTIGLVETLRRLEENGISIPPEVKTNLEALTEIRDNAVHYLNVSPHLAQQVQAIGTASIKNFIELGKLWLDLDLTSSNLFLMPLGFLPPAEALGIAISGDERKVIEYLANLANDPNADDARPFNVALGIEVTFKRTPTPGAIPFIYSSVPGAVPVEVSEEDMSKAYPWDYEELMKHLRARYTDFKANDKWHACRERFAMDPKLKRTRYLEPNNTDSSKKHFYSPNILPMFDSEYTRKSVGNEEQASDRTVPRGAPPNS